MQTLQSARLLSHSCSQWMGASSFHLPIQCFKCRSVITTRLASSQPKSDASRIFVGHTFYKGKSALSITPGRPSFKRTENGDIVLEREGSLFMEFAPATGVRQYDWTRKQVFALSVVELGGLVGLLSNDTCEFFHDPNMNTSDAGMVRKTLKVEAMPDRTGFFFNFMVVNKIEQIDERFSVPVTKAEFAVMRSSFNFIIPYLMGWHAYTNPSVLEKINTVGEAEKVTASAGKVNPDLEWSK